MKKLLILVLPALFLVSCVKDLQDYNVDTKKPSVVSPDPLFSNATTGLNDWMASVNVNVNVFRFYAQYLSTTTYLDEPRYDMTTRLIPQNLWNAMYVSTLSDLNEAAKLINADKIVAPEVKQNKLATIEIMSVYAYSILVNTFGDIPYSQALDVNNPQPVYDDAKTVSEDLLKRVTDAVSKLDDSAEAFGDADLIYGGDVAKWKKFGNSLKLKLAMVMADADAAVAKQAVSEAAAGDLILDNADDAQLTFLVSSPNNNPLSDDVPPRSSRKDFVGANTIIDYMNSVSDPRLPSYFTSVDGAFVGGTYGFSAVYAEKSTVSSRIIDPTNPNVMLDAAEVHFLLAEAIERGFITGDAKEHYDAAIRASFEYWDAGSADTYLAQEKVDYSNAASGATWQEKIGVQKWLALYNRGFDAWTSWRLLDFPALKKPDVAEVPEIPTRLIYPIIENSLNKGNTAAAAAKIGGDEPTTKLWWDVK